MSNMNDFIGGGGISDALIFEGASFTTGVNNEFPLRFADAHMDDGSYLDIDASTVVYYNNSAVAQWTISATDILGATAQGFTPCIYIDKASGLLYVSATNTTIQRLGTIDIANGTFSNPGGTTSNGLVPRVATNLSGYGDSKLVGNTITFVAASSGIGVARYTVDVTTGAFTNAALAGSKEILLCSSLQDSDGDNYSLTWQTGAGISLTTSCSGFYQNRNATITKLGFLGGFLYISSGGYFGQISVRIDADSYYEQMDAYVQKYIDPNMNIARP